MVRYQRPAWLDQKIIAQQNSPITEQSPQNAVDIFSRSTETKAIIAADEKAKELRKKEKLEKKARKREENEKKREELEKRMRDSVIARAAAEAEISSRSEDTHTSKRRRISADSRDASPEDSLLIGVLSPPKSLSPSRRRQPNQVISGGEFHLPSHSLNKSLPSRSAVIELSDDEDNTNTAHKDTDDDEPEAKTLTPPPADTGPNPVMDIFIEPNIPNTKPLLVQRKYKQTLKEVRHAWARVNNLTPTETSAMFLTWRGRRIFDVQSCKSMGIFLDHHGFPYMKSEDLGDQPIDKVAVVATTKAIVEAEKAAAELAKKQREEGYGQLVDEPKVRDFKLILQSKNYDEQRIRIKEDHTFQKVIDVVRKKCEIPDNLTINISFDGEMLDPEMAMKDSELVDEDPKDPILLDVHVR
ncbi:hypothetical protein BT63DRAFT_458232 [Microthyrium microscopicum]|uniref:Rad60/SUMO-like domain-containing protein n=1 Tax=Microthyrium microscopicum TaxID=703497 RepID=A0A6A6U2P2_9PEZI|nr:hypothetical protein BT63DRAFT_458232 [Microthyrium microscopicum]